MKWHEIYPQILKEETKIMKAQTNASLENKQGNLVWYEAIVNNYETEFDIAIVYQPNHPFDPPKAYILKPEVPHSTTYHTHADGSLCLYEPSTVYGMKISALMIRNWACMWATAYENFLNTGEWDYKLFENT